MTRTPSNELLLKVRSLRTRFYTYEGEFDAVNGIDLDVKEIKTPDLDAYLVARNIAEQLERRISFSRAMKRSIQQAMRQGAEGVRVEVAGRLSGSDMARSVNMREGRVPRQTLRADIDYAQTESLTTYGRIGVKVWIYKGEVLPEVEEEVETTEGVYVSE